MEKMRTSRRNFLKLAALGAMGPVFASRSGWLRRIPRPLKPPKLRPGDTVALINPAGAVFDSEDIEVVKERLAALGLKSKVGRHALERYGNFAGRDRDRAADINAAFADPQIKALLAIRGGSGCARILPLLDYDLIRKHPKIVVGYSDITALLLALNAKTGLVTFHGPVGISTWNEFTVSYFKRVLMEGKVVELRNPIPDSSGLVPTDFRIRTVTPGKARGILLGGNLSVLVGLVGTPYLPDFKGAILFLEDVDELWYRLDRMISQLKLAGILDKLSGFVFGQCRNCSPGKGYGSLSFEDILNDQIKPLKIPAFAGAAIGHIKNKFTLPVGAEVEIDANAGIIRLTEPAVV